MQLFQSFVTDQFGSETGLSVNTLPVFNFKFIYLEPYWNQAYTE